ncbi:hypothetical protein GBP346_A3823 [Burkholderia pseudomallei MSHR346]|nr:hypothetical protein GBP346_A3823 [Burkholderia pseudomallei MSHR346]
MAQVAQASVTKRIRHAKGRAPGNRARPFLRLTSASCGVARRDGA